MADGPVDVARGEDGDGLSQHLAGALLSLLAEPADTVVAQGDFGMTAETSQFVVGAGLSATPERRGALLGCWFARHDCYSKSCPAAATSRQMRRPIAAASATSTAWPGRSGGTTAVRWSRLQ